MFDFMSIVFFIVLHSFKDMLRFINEGGDDGFVLVSFGSGARISDAPEEIQNIFFTALGTTKTRFIFKWEDERPANMPDNIMISNWIPQQEILGKIFFKQMSTIIHLMQN